MVAQNSGRGEKPVYFSCWLLWSNVAPYRCLISLQFGLHMDQRSSGAGSKGLKPEARPCQAVLEHTWWKPLWKWLLRQWVQ